MDSPIFSFESISLLLAKLHKQAQRNFREVLSAYGLSSMHAIFFHALQKSGDGLTQKHITEMLHCDKANTSRAIKDLLEKGYVSKDTKAENERNMKLYLTESGEQIAQELQETMGRLKAKIADCLTEEEKQTFRQIINKINALELQ